jgi:hypothetical protein
MRIPICNGKRIASPDRLHKSGHDAGAPGFVTAGKRLALLLKTILPD